MREGGYVRAADGSEGIELEENGRERSRCGVPALGISSRGREGSTDVEGDTP